MAEQREQLRRSHQKSFRQAWDDPRMNKDEEESQIGIGTRPRQKYLFYKKHTAKSPNSYFLPRLLPTVSNVHMDERVWNVLCNEVFAVMIPRLVRDTLAELCEEYLEVEAISSLIGDLTSEIVLDQEGQSLANEVLNELHEEFFLTDKIQDPVLLDLLHEVAAETIEGEKEQQFKQDSNEVAIVAQQNLLDSFLHEELLLLTTEQGRLWTETEEQNRILDGLMMDVLLHQLHKFQETKTFIHDCIPFLKLHQRIVADINLNILQQQLSACLIEDERKLDDFEKEQKTIPSSTNWTTKIRE